MSGTPHTDNGFRLRSYNPNASSSFKKIDLKYSLSDKPCPLTKGDIGVYWLKIICENDRWDYIGRSYDGIPNRLKEHFSKIAGTTELADFEDPKKFKEMRKDIKKKYNIITWKPEFFDNHIEIALVKIDRNKTYHKEKINKIEGLALATYKRLNGNFPNLNDKNETVGLEGFDELYKT